MPALRPATSASPQSDAELGEFLLRVCHDFRGPIRTIRTHTELLAKSRASEPEDAPEPALDFILSGVQSAANLVDGLTDYSLALQIDPSGFLPVPMDVMLRSAMAKLAAVIRENGCEVSYGDLPAIPGNADRLLQLFEYLLDHAIRHRGSAAPKIHVAAEPHEDGWLFSVRDNGAGIEPDMVDRIFTPFERVQGKERPGPGLATCRIIVERHNGRIWAQSEPGAGTTFRFTLPAK